MVLDRLRQWYHSRVSEVTPETSTTVFLQVVVLNAMKPRRLSPRVLLQASIWSVVLIVLSFILIYSILLTYFDRRVAYVSHGQPRPGNTLKHKYNHVAHKVKFRSKASGPLLFAGGRGGISGRESHRKVLWDSADYFDELGSSPGCRNDSLLTIIITSSPDHTERREAIRQTWCNNSASGHSDGAWQCVFLVGRSSSELNAAIEDEMDEFKDILRGKYIDSYRNLTYKVLHGLDWSNTVCPTPYTLKTDDDCFVNTLQLVPFLRYKNKVVSDLYVGNINLDMEKRIVIRNSLSKWSVPEDDYPEKYYPPYASGTGYVMSRDLVAKIATKSRYVTVIPNEDAYVGILVESIGIEAISSPRFTLFTTGLRLCNYLYVLVSHGVKAHKQHVLHSNMMQAPKQCAHEAVELDSWS